MGGALFRFSYVARFVLHESFGRARRTTWKKVPTQRQRMPKCNRQVEILCKATSKNPKKLPTRLKKLTMPEGVNMSFQGAAKGS